MVGADLVNLLLQEILEEKELLKGILNELLVQEIKDTEIRDKWDNFEVEKLKPILQRSISVDKPALVRVHCAFKEPVQLLVLLNGNMAYLNQSLLLKENSAYVFDVPVNSGDALNLAVNFDDSQYVTVHCIFLRLQVVR